jgi:IclR family acetate operon transcriptional repressor
MSATVPASATTDARFGHVQSVLRALDLLEALAGEEPTGLVELAGRAGLQPSTARRLLATMAARGYVAQSRSSARYHLGHRALELRTPVERRTRRLRRIARAHLERARRVCGETVSLVVPADTASVLWVDQALGAPPLTPLTGHCLPAHATAPGKALLATWSGAAIARRYGTIGLEARTERTIATLTALRDDLALTRERGFAVEDEELQSGTAGVAAAVAVDRAAPVAAIGVSGPAARLRQVGLGELGEMVSIFAEELGGELARDAVEPVAAG